jgi:hypothetical protein
MQQINENLVVLQPGDPFEEIFGDMIKIYLSGTLDLIGGPNKLPWQQKFINALAKISSEEPREGMPDLRNIKFLVINPLAPTDGPMSLDNDGFVQKIQWELQCQEQADIIFCNFLKKGKDWNSLTGLLLNSKGNKLVVRCPIDSEFYGLIKILGQNFEFPVVGDSASAYVIVKAMAETNQKLKDLLENGI